MRKGFTLIELLAVIVILAIIALIATPIIINIIKNTQDSANKRSVENYAKAIENTVAKEMMRNNGNMDNIKGFYSTIGNTKQITNGINTYTIDYDGTEVVCDYIEIHKNGTVYLEDCKAGNSQKDDLAYGTREGLSYYDNYIPVETFENLGATENDDITGKLYANSDIDGTEGYTLVFTGNGEMRSFSTYPWQNYKEKIINVEIEHGTTNILAGFRGCTNLTNITIPNSVIDIDGNAFDDTAWYNAQSDGIIYINSVLYEYKGTMSENTSITVKEGIKSISNGAFQGCANLTNITIPNSITYIGAFAFSGCSGLTSVILPNKLIKITGFLFRDCTNLSSVEIPSSVTYIDFGIFQNCVNLTSITIPSSVTHIDEDAFYNSSIETIYYKGSLPIPDNKWGATGATIITDF